ncbi:MAG: transposase, partial [Actinobacteria bacterium]|nr:transposase [Actinomycetota bacterium]
LVRVAENACEESWPNLRRELQKSTLGRFAGAAGSFCQRTELTAAQRAILAKLELAEPPRISELTPAALAS